MPNKEIIATLEKPYTENQRMDFIVEYNHNQGCEIEELEKETLQAFKMVKTDEEKQKAERERLDRLNVTRGDMFEALILARQITKTQIREMIVQNVTDPVQQTLMLNRFDEALNYYRGYPIFDMLGAIVGITPKQWDNYFIKATNEETKENAYKELLPVEPTTGENSNGDQSDQSLDKVDTVEEKTGL